MELKTTQAFHELIETIGENKEFVFTLKIPGNFTWEMLHAVIQSMAAGAKEWQSLVAKQLEEMAEKSKQEESNPEGIEEVTPEVIA